MKAYTVDVIMLTTNVLPSCSGAASTAVDALREKVLAMLANNGAELFGLKAAHHIAMSPKTCLSGTSLGRYVEVMPTFEKAAPPSELLPPPTPTQWKALFAALGLPEQPEDADWVRLLYPRELNAQRSKKRKHDDGLGYASSTPPVTFDPVPGPKEQVQLAVGNILRATESAGMTTLHWRDTSRCGVNNSSYKPNFTGFVTHAEVWTSMVTMLSTYLMKHTKPVTHVIFAFNRPHNACSMQDVVLDGLRSTTPCKV